MLHTGFKKPLGRPLALCQQSNVVCIADAWDSASLELLVKLVQIDVRQQ